MSPLIKGQPVRNSLSRFRTKDLRETELVMKIKEQPNALFYKDEGGKSNCLKASCFITFKSSTNECPTVPIGNLKISPRLIYENGSEIEDEKEIFKVMKTIPETITSTNETFMTHFRVEKVSRRKDGRKFAIRFDVDYDSTKLLDYVIPDSLEPQETTPITVLSKRKAIPMLGPNNNHPNSWGSHLTQTSGVLKKEKKRQIRRMTSADDPRSQLKSLKSVFPPETVNLPVSFVEKLKDSVKLLESRVQSLSNRVEFLEGQRESNGIPELEHEIDERDLGFQHRSVKGELTPTHYPSSCVTDGGLRTSSLGRKNNSANELFEFFNTSRILN